MTNHVHKVLYATTCSHPNTRVVFSHIAWYTSSSFPRTFSPHNTSSPQKLHCTNFTDHLQNQCLLLFFMWALAAGWRNRGQQSCAPGCAQSPNNSNQPHSCSNNHGATFWPTRCCNSVGRTHDPTPRGGARGAHPEPPRREARCLEQVQLKPNGTSTTYN